MAYFQRGYTYANKGERDKAIAAYTKAIELKPDLSVAYYNRGIIYENIGEHAKAAADFAKAKELGYVDDQA